MCSAFCATATTPSAISTPAAFASAQRAASMSWPITCHPAPLRFFDIAPPMMPRPMMPTVLELALMLSPNRVVVVLSGMQTVPAGETHANRNCRARAHGCRDGGAADGCRPYAQRLESLTRKNQAAHRCGREACRDAG